MLLKTYGYRLIKCTVFNLQQDKGITITYANNKKDK